MKIKSDITTTQKLFGEAAALHTPRLAGDVARIMQRREKADGGFEYLVGCPRPVGLNAGLLFRF